MESDLRTMIEAEQIEKDPEAIGEGQGTCQGAHDGDCIHRIGNGLNQNRR